MSKKILDVDIKTELNDNPNPPLAYTNYGTYLYHLLSDRKFEILVYSIFKEEISDGKYNDRYDNISLMVGVAERGRDSVLYLKGESVGLIQCKHSSNPSNRMTKPDVACEIIKFALNYLIDKALISNLSEFTYYFVVSADFTEPAIELLSDFNNRILLEGQFKDWVDATQKKYTEFQSFDFKSVEGELKLVLQSIKVIKMTATDLNIKLSAHPDLVSQFFSVEKVVPIEQVKEIMSDVNQATSSVLSSQVRVEGLISDVRDQINGQFSKIPSIFESNIALSTEYKEQLNHVKQLLDRFMSKEALNLLSSLKERIWDKTTPDDKNRILTYMGIAQLQQGEQLEATTLLLEALLFNSESAKALSYAALAYLLKGDFQRCLSFSSQAINKDPTLTQAYSMIVWCTSDEEPIESVIAKIPDVYVSSPEVATALGDLAFKRNSLQIAEQWYRTAINSDKKGLPDIRAKLAIVLLTGVQNFNIGLHIKGFLNPLDSIIKEVVALLSFAWEKVSNTDVRSYRVDWLINLGVAKLMAGDKDGAIKDLDDALAKEPNNSYIIRNRGLLALQSNDKHHAETLFRRLIEIAPESDAKLLLAGLLFEGGNINQAETYLQEIINSSDSSPLFYPAVSILISIKLSVHDTQAAWSLLEPLKQKYSEDVDVLILGASIARSEGNTDTATQLLNQAQSIITPESSAKTLFCLAEEFFANGVFESAATLLEKIVDTETNSRVTQQLIECYYKSGNLNPALKICEVLRQKHGPLQFVTPIEAAIYDEIDDLGKAKQICNDYLEVYPYDLSMKVRSATVNFKLKDFDSVDSFLQQNIDFRQVSFDTRAAIIQLLISRKFEKKAIEIAYETRREYFNNPIAHQMYIIGVFLRLEQTDSEGWFDVDHVKLDTAVNIVEKDADQSRWIVIESREDADIRRDELTPKHPLVKKLLGGKVGDVVTISQGVTTSEYQIKELKSKYVHAFHESMEIYQTYFPDTPGIWRFCINHAEDESVTRDSFKPLFDLIDENHSFLEKGKNLYKKRLITIGALASFLNRNPINVQAMLSESLNHGLYCCSGLEQERVDANKLLLSKPPLLVDITAIVTLTNLGVRDIVLDTYGKFVLVRSTVELIEQVLDDYNIRSNAIGYLDKTGNEATDFEVTEDIRERNKKILEDLLDWVTKKCEIIPCRAALNIERNAKEKLGKMLGVSFLETALVASSEGMVLYTDDGLFREFANSEYQIQGVWTQALLNRLLDEGTLTTEVYNNSIIRLIDLQYHNVSVSSNVLLEAARLAEWKPQYPFTQVINVLNGRHSNKESSVQVAVDFLYRLWAQNLLPDRYQQLVIAVLNAITSNRGYHERNQVICTIEQEMQLKFLLAPLDAARLRNTITAWEKIHLTK